MKKIYCIVLLDPVTKEIIHSITSDAPIPDESIITVEDIDENSIIYDIEKYEFNNQEDTMIRAREIIESMEKVGNAPLKLKTGMEAKQNRFNGLAKVTEFT